MLRRNVRQEFEASPAKKCLVRKRKKNKGPDALKELMSPKCLGIIEHFGVEAPQLTNNYYCVLEDALIE